MAKAAGDGRAAMCAVACVVQRVIEDLVPVALDHGLAAAGTVGGIATAIMHVAGINVTQAGIQSVSLLLS